jgi:low affinity Fe/Cu permease
MSNLFRKCSEAMAKAVGSPYAFLVASAAVMGWAASGPLFGYSDTWQLIINTSTTIVTFLIVFLIQNTQNRDTEILNLKLDELIRAHGDARNGFAALENYSDDDLHKLRDRFAELCSEHPDLVKDDIDDIDEAIRRRKTTAH